MNIAVYPGTFDPFTNGHRDLVQRAASNIFDKVYICVVENSNKNTVFSLDERVALAKKSLENIQNIEVIPFSGLLVDFATKLNAKAFVDFIYISASMFLTFGETQNFLIWFLRKIHDFSLFLLISFNGYPLWICFTIERKG